MKIREITSGGKVNFQKVLGYYHIISDEQGPSDGIGLIFTSAVNDMGRTLWFPEKMSMKIGCEWFGKNLFGKK